MHAITPSDSWIASLESPTTTRSVTPKACAALRESPENPCTASIPSYPPCFGVLVEPSNDRTNPRWSFGRRAYSSAGSIRTIGVRLEGGATRCKALSSPTKFVIVEWSSWANALPPSLTRWATRCHGDSMTANWVDRPKRVLDVLIYPNVESMVYALIVRPAN
ncbi:unnamed protein product [Phytophthora fragariaefolia]|uniref:Unnamed protein product n=1 Tax=Phytophthora fragariaefolia TaxID=1490495 RepID=A0A9W6WX17_9STRA|nr:unnamed protein product [Phytophthora fragariaefolia]